MRIWNRTAKKLVHLTTILTLFAGITLLPLLATPGQVYGDPLPSETHIVADNCAQLSNCDIITQYLNPMIEFLSAGTGLAVIISIVIGGIQYSMAGGDPSAVSKAKARIRNSVIALIAFFLLFAVLNWLVPGGLMQP